MTTQTIGHSSATARRPQWVRSCRWMLGGTMHMILWGWALVIVLAPVILFIVSRFADITVSGVAYSHQGLVWYPFSIALIFAVTYLPVQVANGMTRRSFIRAVIVTNVATGLANAAFTMIALFIERAIYEQLGWAQGRTDGKGVDLFATSAGVYAVDLAVLFVGAMVSGTLVGITFYRFRAWATLMLPLTVFPVVGTALFGLSEATRWSSWSVDFPGSWMVTTLVGVVVLVAACAAIVLLARRVALDTRKG